MADEPTPKTPAAPAAHASTGDSTADTTQAAHEAKTPRVPKAGDHFPWEYRDTEEVEDKKAKAKEGEAPPLKKVDRVTKCIATITSVSRDLVWCDLEPDKSLGKEEIARVNRAIGFPRHIHVMMTDAKKALGLSTK